MERQVSEVVVEFYEKAWASRADLYVSREPQDWQLVRLFLPPFHSIAT